LITKDKSQLTNYFNILNSIGKNLEILENNGHKYPEIGLAVSAEKEANVVEVKNLKKLSIRPTKPQKILKNQFLTRVFRSLQNFIKVITISKNSM